MAVSSFIQFGRRTDDLTIVVARQDRYGELNKSGEKR